MVTSNSIMVRSRPPIRYFTQSGMVGWGDTGGGGDGGRGGTSGADSPGSDDNPGGGRVVEMRVWAAV